MPKLKFTAECVIDVDRSWYPVGSSVEDMVKTELENDNDAIFDTIITAIENGTGTIKVEEVKE